MIAMDTVTMGYAQADITPTEACQLAGFEAREDNLSRGVWHRLLAQVLFWQGEEPICCLITIDSLGFTVALTDKLRKQVAQKLGLAAEQVMVCFSHTHAAPNAAEEKAYYRFVCEQIVEAACRARLFAVPVQVAWGMAVNTVGSNRRAGKADFDERLGVLQITDVKGNVPLAILLRITAHANVLLGDNWRISSDYFGAVRQRLSARYGCPVLVIQGASGDVRPKYRQDDGDFWETHPAEAAVQAADDALWRKQAEAQSEQALTRMAEQVEQAVAAVWADLSSQPVKNVAMFSQTHTFFADVPTVGRAQTIAAEAKQFAAIDGRGWLEEVQRLQNDGIARQQETVELQYFCLNEGCLCGVPHEIMSDIAMMAWQQAQAPLFFLNGYTNGCTGYWPTAEEYDAGGYEVLWSYVLYYAYHGRVMPLNRQSADELSDVAIKAWQAYRKMLEKNLDI